VSRQGRIAGHQKRGIGGDHQLPATLPDGVVHTNYAPFDALPPRAAAVVHHGGIGTLSEALAAGVPQLIQPMAFDQFDNASRACRLGVPRELLPRRYRAEVVARQLAELMGDSRTSAACESIRSSMKRNDGLPAI
jgi:rhamnosyltransferase subunit B